MDIPLHSIECKGEEDDLERMQNMLNINPSNVNQLQPSAYGENYPLHSAIYMGHKNCVKLLLKSGACPDILDPSGKTALEIAIISSSQEENIELLLKHDASVNYLWNDCPRTKYLELAIEKGLNNIIKLLLEKGADTDDYYINNFGQKRLKINYESPLINALWEENTEIFKLLLYHGSYLECYINDKNSIPHIIIASYVLAMECIEVSNIFKEYGGNLWSLQPDLKDRTEELETALQSLRRTPLVYQFKGGPLDIDVKLEELMGKPLSLQSLCRIVIKQQIGRNYWEKVSLLPLPGQIIKFLKYHDI